MFHTCEVHIYSTAPQGIRRLREQTVSSLLIPYHLCAENVLTRGSSKTNHYGLS